MFTTRRLSSCSICENIMFHSPSRASPHIRRPLRTHPCAAVQYVGGVKFCFLWLCEHGLLEKKVNNSEKEFECPLSTQDRVRSCPCARARLRAPWRRVRQPERPVATMWLAGCFTKKKCSWNSPSFTASPKLCSVAQIPCTGDNSARYIRSQHVCHRDPRSTLVVKTRS